MNQLAVSPSLVRESVCSISEFSKRSWSPVSVTLQNEKRVIKHLLLFRMKRGLPSICYSSEWKEDHLLSVTLQNEKRIIKHLLLFRMKRGSSNICYSSEWKEDHQYLLLFRMKRGLSNTCYSSEWKEDCQASVTLQNEKRITKYLLLFRTKRGSPAERITSSQYSVLVQHLFKMTTQGIDLSHIRSAGYYRSIL